jgi:hypothetical protein
MQRIVPIILLAAACGDVIVGRSRGGGGNVAGGTCPSRNLPACGGDPVGIWRYQVTCPSRTPIFQDTPACTASWGEARIEGEQFFELHDDGTFAVTGDGVNTMHIETPLSCLEAQYQGQVTGDAACDQYAVAIRWQAQVEPRCSVAGSICICEYEPDISSKSSGTYEVTPGALTFDSPGGFWTMDYCIKDDTFVQRFEDGAQQVVYQRAP